MDIDLAYGYFARLFKAGGQARGGKYKNRTWNGKRWVYDYGNEGNKKLSYISEKLYAANKKAKEIRDDKGDFDLQKRIYDVKDKLIEKFGKFTGKIHEFPRGIGVEYTLTGKDSFHKYFRYHDDFFDWNTEKALKDKEVTNVISNLKKQGLDVRFQFEVSDRVSYDLYQDGFIITPVNNITSQIQEIRKKIETPNVKLLNDSDLIVYFNDNGELKTHFKSNEKARMDKINALRSKTKSQKEEYAKLEKDYNVNLNLVNKKLDEIKKDQSKLKQLQEESQKQDSIIDSAKESLKKVLSENTSFLSGAQMNNLEKLNMISSENKLGHTLTMKDLEKLEKYGYA